MEGLENDIYYMREAISEAKLAQAIDEAPIGAVIVCDGKIVGRGYNRRETDKTALGHAEIYAIKEACRTLGGWRLHRCTLYVTLEPCIMCAGAIVNARIKRVVFGADDEKAGSFGSVLSLNDYRYNHKPEIVRGILKDECSALMSDFFSELRKKREQQKKGVVD